MAKQGYPASGTRYGDHPGVSGYPAAGSRYGSHPDSATAAVTPTTILGGQLLRWIELGAGSEVVSGGEVTDLLDLSGNGYHMSAIATQRGIYEPTGWNGRPSLSLDASNDFYTNNDTGVGAHATALVGGTADKSFTVWLVVQFFSVGTLQVPYSCGNTAGTTPFFDVFVNGTPNYCATKSFTTTKTLIGSTTSDTNRHILELQSQGTTAQLSLDGSPLPGAGFAANNWGATSAGTVNRDTIGALGRNTVANFMFGRFVAKITASGTLTAGQVTAMNSYLSKFITPQTAPMLIVAGDSLSTANNWQVDFQAAYPSAVVSNAAVAGQTLFGYGTPNVARDGWSKYDSNRSATLLSAQWGSNDIVNAVSGSTLHTNLTNYVSTIKAKNPNQKVMVSTVGWRQGLTGSEETERQAFNTAVRASKAGADYLLDRDVILTSADAGTLYLDGTHPNAAGNTFMWTGRNGAQGIRDYVIAAGF